MERVFRARRDARRSPGVHDGRKTTQGDHSMSDVFEITRLDVYALEAKIATPVAP